MRSHKLRTKRAEVPTVRKWKALLLFALKLGPSLGAKCMDSSCEQAPVHRRAFDHIAHDAFTEQLLIKPRMQAMAGPHHPQIPRGKGVTGPHVLRNVQRAAEHQ